MGVMLMIGTAKGMFILESDSKRTKWSRRGPYHKGWMTYGLFADKRPKDPVLYAGVSNFVFGPHIQRSTDGGETWAKVDNGPSFTEESGRKLEHIWGFANGPKPNTLYCGVSQAALFESKDNGLNWSINEPLENYSDFRRDEREEHGTEGEQAREQINQLNFRGLRDDRSLHGMRGGQGSRSWPWMIGTDCPPTRITFGLPSSVSTVTSMRLAWWISIPCSTMKVGEGNFPLAAR